MPLWIRHCLSIERSFGARQLVPRQKTRVLRKVVLGIGKHACALMHACNPALKINDRFSTYFRLSIANVSCRTLIDPTAVQRVRETYD